MFNGAGAVRQFALAFLLAWLIDVLLSLLVFGLAAAGSDISSNDFGTGFLDAVLFTAPGTAIRAALLIGLALLIAGTVTRFFPQTRLLSYAAAGAMVPMAVLGIQGWQLHWMSGSIGAIALLVAALFTRPQ